MMTLQSLIGKRVHSSDGTCLGHVFAFRGERDGSDLRVTHLRVGLGAWIERLWPHARVRRLFTRQTPLELPWEAIESVDREVHLKGGWNVVRARWAAMEEK
jgi:sporulation protein YlmC with PRC-barrel domain